MRNVVAIALLSTAVSGSALAAAAPLLGEAEATAKAVAFIKGDTYGLSSMGISSHIKQREMQRSGSNDCGPIKTPLWAFRFQTKLAQTPIDGWLYIDASTGDVACSTIPFLR